VAHARLDEIINFYEISPLIGTAGQPRADQFAIVRDAGYRLVINLAPSFAERAIPNEGEIVRGLGMEYVHIPVIWDAPQVAELEQFFQVMQQHQDVPVFVHCQVNYRVSAFMYLYRLRYGLTSEKQAEQDLHWLWQPNATWQAFIDRVRVMPNAGG